MRSRKDDHTLAWCTMNRHLLYKPGESEDFVMDVATVTQVIGSLGFPIVACIAVGWYVVKVQTKMFEAINNNTLALTKLAEKIDSGKGV